MNLKLSRCCGQFYDGAGNTSGAKQILKEEERALYPHCYGHALNLAAGDFIRKSLIMSDALDNCQEISDFSSIHQKETLYFVRLKLKLLNWISYFMPNYECLQTVKKPDSKARINGVKIQMEKFNFFCGIQLGERTLKHTDNL